VTTVLGQEGLGPGSTTRHTPADPRKKQLQQYQQRQQEQSSSGKRKLEALGLASAKKRQKGEGAAGKVAAPKPLAEIGTCGRSARAAVTGADVAAHAASGGVEDAGPETSQAPSIHKLLHSVKRRQAVASHQSEPDRWTLGLLAGGCASCCPTNVTPSRIRSTHNETHACSAGPILPVAATRRTAMTWLPCTPSWWRWCASARQQRSASRCNAVCFVKSLCVVLGCEGL
jgi:hypothetical protein